jgi:hypothetical protein
MSITKSTGRANLTKNAFWLGPGRPTDNENKLGGTKSTVLGKLPLLNGKYPDPCQTVGSGSVSN